MTRTHDLLITNQLLYRLSYSSIFSFWKPGLVVTNQLLYRLSYTSNLLRYSSTKLPPRQAGNPEMQEEIRSPARSR